MLSALRSTYLTWMHRDGELCLDNVEKKWNTFSSTKLLTRVTMTDKLVLVNPFWWNNSLFIVKCAVYSLFQVDLYSARHWLRGWTGGVPFPHFPPPFPPLPSPSPPLPSPSTPTSHPLSDLSLPLIKLCSCSWPKASSRTNIYIKNSLPKTHLHFHAKLSRGQRVRTYFSLYVWFDALRPNQQLWSCRDGQFI